MKRIILGFLIINLLGCGEKGTEKDSKFTKEVDGSFVSVEEVNDTLIRRVRLNKNRELDAIEREDIKNNEVKIYYFDDEGRFIQTVNFNTKSQRLFENCVYSDGVLLEKLIKNDDNEVLSKIEFDSDGRLMKKEYYREGNLAMAAFVSYNMDGTIDLSEHKSHYLKLRKDKNILYVTPVGMEMTVFEDAKISVVENFKNSNHERTVIKNLLFTSTPVLKVDLSEFDLSKELKCEVLVNITSKNDEASNYAYYELYLEDLNSIPRNNLYPIFSR